jgi:hypothetical protein
MKKIIFFCAFAVFAGIYADNTIDKKDIEGRTWAVLSFVFDTEKGATINKDGIQHRLNYETLIQTNGGTIYTMARSERKKLEKMWSSPFTGRLSDELKKYAKKNQICILTGSYSINENNKVSLLHFDYKVNKVLVHHNQAISVHVEKENIVPVRKEKRNRVLPKDSFTIDLQPYESVRRRPEHFKGRRAKRENKEKALQLMKKHFSTNPVLQTLKKEYANSSDKEKIKAAQDLTRRATESWLTTSKIELMSRAWVLLDMVPGVSEKEKNEILYDIIERENFSADWGGED